MQIQPVIHILNKEQTLANAEICAKCGVKQIWLIRHDFGDDAFEELLETYDLVKNKYPDFWIGVNILQYDSVQASFLSSRFEKLDGFWLDNPMFESSEEKAALIRSNISCQYFGGVAFKYQKQPTDLKVSCEKALQYMDVVTTSGNRTGYGPSIEKIEKMREYVGSGKLAIASGLDKENVKAFKDLVDYGLVASSITGSGELIIEEKLIEILECLK